MMQVMSLPYLLQSLVSTKTATCVQPQLGGVVHHYPSHCSVDRSSTATNNSGRMERQCQMMPVAVKHGRHSTGTAPPVQIKKEIKTEEGSQVHYRHCPTDTYSQQQIRYTLDYRVENRSSRNHHTHFVSKTAMSPDCDSLFTQGPFPLSPLATPNQGFYYSATEADFSSLYDFPSQSSMDSTSYDMYGSSSSSEDLTSPVFTKMADSQGGTSELLSLDELSNSGLGYDGYLGCSGVENGLDQDWLVEQVSLPSPEEQESDVKLTPVSSAPPQSLELSYRCSSTPVASTSSLLTPDPSLPASPLSIHSYSSEEDELKDVLSFFEDSDGGRLDMPTAVQPFAPHQILPVVSPREVLEVGAPSSSIGSPVVSLPPSPLDSDDSCDSVHDLLSRRESSVSLPPSPLSARGASGSTDRSRKRKSLPISSSDKQSCAPTPTPKRRMTKASKKERKREQNKTAALRYRQKKKGEKSDIETRRAELEEKNEELKAKVDSLSNEINYLKKLWSEVSANRKSL